MGRPSEYLETVLTCEGDYYSPSFTQHLDSFRQKLEQLITDGNYFILKFMYKYIYIIYMV